MDDFSRDFRANDPSLYTILPPKISTRILPFFLDVSEFYESNDIFAVLELAYKRDSVDSGVLDYLNHERFQKLINFDKIS